MLRWIPLLGAVAVIAAAGWFGWHHFESRGCGERTCAAPSEEAPIALASGQAVSVIHRWLDGREQPVVEYLTAIDRSDTAALCAEVKSVWEAVKGDLDTRRTRRVRLGPTNPATEFLGMQSGIVPLYTCCVTTYFWVEKGREGEWSFPDCPG